MLSQNYSRYVFVGLLALVPLASWLGWSSREIWGSMLIVGIAFTLLLLDVAGSWREPRTRLPVSLFVFAGLVLVSTVVSTYRYLSLIGFLQLAASLSVFQLARRHATAKKRQYAIAAVLVSTGLITSIYALLQVITLSNLEIGAGSTFVWKNAFAGFLTLICPLAVAGYLTTVSRWRKIGLAIIIGCLGAALFFTNSQAAWIAASIGIAIVVFGVAANQRHAWKSISAQLVLPALLSIAVISGLFRLNAWFISSESVPELFTLQQITFVPPTSIQSRLNYWETSWRIVQQFPWFGVGLGNFATWYTHEFTSPWLYTISPHNWMFALLVTIGIPATLALGIFLVLTAWKTIRSVVNRREAATRTPYLILWAAAATSLLVHSLLDLSLEVPAINVLWWMVLGMLYGNLKTTTVMRPWHPFGGILRSAGCVALLTLTFLVLIADNFYLQAVKLQNTMGQTPQRIALLQRSQQLMPLSANTAEALSNASWDAVLDHVGNRQTNLRATLSYAQTAAGLDPDSAHRQWILGKAYYFAQTPDHPYWPQIVFHLQQTIAYDFHDPTYYQTLAEVYLRLNWNEKARQTIIAGLNLYPQEELNRIVAGQIIYQQFGLREKLERLRALLPYTETE